jgi:uncharacterized protein DUF6481
MSNRGEPTLQDRLSRAADAKSAMLAKFKRGTDPKNPVAIENRRQREAIVGMRAERAAQREAARQQHERELARQAALAAVEEAAAERAAAEQAAREAAERAEREAALKAQQKAERDPAMRHAKRPRRSGEGATDRPARPQALLPNGLSRRRANKASSGH